MVDEFFAFFAKSTLLEIFLFLIYGELNTTQIKKLFHEHLHLLHWISRFPIFEKNESNLLHRLGDSSAISKTLHGQMDPKFSL